MLDYLKFSVGQVLIFEFGTTSVWPFPFLVVFGFLMTNFIQDGLNVSLARAVRILDKIIELNVLDSLASITEATFTEKCLNPRAGV